MFGLELNLLKFLAFVDCRFFTVVRDEGVSLLFRAQRWRGNPGLIGEAAVACNCIVKGLWRKNVL